MFAVLYREIKLLIEDCKVKAKWTLKTLREETICSKKPIRAVWSAPLLFAAWIVGFLVTRLKCNRLILDNAPLPLQNVCKTIGFQKEKKGLQISPWEEVNHLWPATDQKENNSLSTISSHISALYYSINAENNFIWIPFVFLHLILAVSLSMNYSRRTNLR